MALGGDFIGKLLLKSIYYQRVITLLELSQIHVYRGN